MFGAPHDQIPGPVLSLSLDAKPTTVEVIRWLLSQGDAPYEDLLSRPQGLFREKTTTIVQPAGEDDSVRLDILPADVAAELAAVEAAKPVRGFKYRLTVRRLLETMNSAYRNAPTTRARYPVNPAFMNPLDMEEEGIGQETKIEIASDHGAVIAYVQPDPTMRRGTIGMAHTWGAAEAACDPQGRTGAFTGRLVSLEANRESINYMPRQSAIPVNVKPLS
jgi:anaerobic selenocysteine-containing dehydrogenase